MRPLYNQGNTVLRLTNSGGVYLLSLTNPPPVTNPFWRVYADYAGKVTSQNAKNGLVYLPDYGTVKPANDEVAITTQDIFAAVVFSIEHNGLKLSDMLLCVGEDNELKHLIKTCILAEIKNLFAATTTLNRKTTPYKHFHSLQRENLIENNFIFGGDFTDAELDFLDNVQFHYVARFLASLAKRYGVQAKITTAQWQFLTRLYHYQYSALMWDDKRLFDTFTPAFVQQELRGVGLNRYQWQFLNSQLEYQQRG